MPLGISVTKHNFSNFYRKFLAFKFSWISSIFASFKSDFASPKFQIKMTKICLRHKYLRAIKPTTPFFPENYFAVDIFYEKKLGFVQRAVGWVVINETVCWKNGVELFCAFWYKCHKIYFWNFYLKFLLRKIALNFRNFSVRFCPAKILDNFKKYVLWHLYQKAQNPTTPFFCKLFRK